MLTSLLLERPWLLLALLVMVEVGFAVYWSNRRTRRAVTLVCVGLLAVVALPSLSILVVTAREQAVDLCHALARAVGDGDMDAIRERLAPDFEAAGFDRATFVERVETTLTRFHVLHPRLSDLSVELPEEGFAVATFRASCRIQTPQGDFARLPSRWRLHLRRSGKGWAVISIETLPVPPLNARNLRDLMR